MRAADNVRLVERVLLGVSIDSPHTKTTSKRCVPAVMNMMDRMQSGRAHPREIDMLLELTKQIEGRTICALGDAAAWPIQGLMRHFRPLVEARLEMYNRENGGVMFGGHLKRDVDKKANEGLAVPDNLGRLLPDVGPVSPPS